MSYKQQDLMNNWHRYYRQGSQRHEAYIVTHGSYDGRGFTSELAPSNIYFYTFHGHSMYTVEILQVINYQTRVAFGNQIVNCKRKVPTSIMGEGAQAWNYWLSAWAKDETEDFIRNWKQGNNSNADLLMLTAGKGGMFSDPPNSTLNGLFQALNNANLRYPKIHFCCCRSDKNSGERPRSDPGSTKPLYKSSNPYWS